MVRRVRGAVKAHWVLSSIALVAIIGGGTYAWSQFGWLVSTPYSDVSYRVPVAPTLTAAAGQTVYRIDPTRSQAQYGVDETFIGAKASHATGTTNGIAGDIALDPSTPSGSKVGDIVVDLEQLHSDNSLRDARIRGAFLESHANPLARFTTTALNGLPATMQPGTAYHFGMSGSMTAKKVTAPVAWSVTAKVVDGRLEATATTTVKMSTFGIGPISIVGLLSTSDDVDLTLRLVAVDPSKVTVPSEIKAPTSVVLTRSGPSFSRQVQPVLEQQCAGCHAAGQVGAAHWKLQNAGDASTNSYSIGLVTAARYMPPWPASRTGVPLQHSRALDQKTLDMLAAWAGAGGPLDVPASTPVKPAKGANGPQPRADVTLRMPTPYLGSQNVPNDYRCFTLDPGFTQSTYITGYRFTPDQITEIHHAQIFRIPAAGVAGASAHSGQDGKPGWSCYTGPGFAAGGGRSELIAGWAPGQEPAVIDKAGILMQPGDQLVLQIHYHYDTAPTPDRSTLTLQTTPGTANLPRLLVVNPLAPVEIPCAAGTQATLCVRNAAIAQLGTQYGLAAQIEGGLLQRCGTTPQELVARSDTAAGIATSSCDWPVRRPGDIVSVLGHMHTLGSSFRMTLDPGTPDEKVLLDIPTWNFDWQLNYQLATPVHVGPGDTVRISCTWDRSRDPARPGRYIVFAEGTEDEMCFATYGLVTDANR